MSNYSIHRNSFGLQDSDNDGKADNSLTQIEKGTPWFDQNKSKLKTAYAGFGDKLEDRLLAYFGAGDPGAGGYNYPMMVQQNADLNYLQLARKIPHGNSLMNITVDTIVIYIDTPDTTQNDPCIECLEYGLSPAQFSTQRKLVITSASINNYLYTVGDYYLFTFSSWDSAGNWIGNLHNPTLTTDSSINHPLQGFFENQRYRIRVNYSICSNFMMANNDIVTDLEDVRKESEIKNTMWLSGSPKPANPFDSSFVAQPASDTLLHLAGWSFPPDSIGSEVDSIFAQQYLFICEDFGGKLYFFSHDGRNNSAVGDQNYDCIKSIHISSEARVGGNLLKVYPYEYRPATFQASVYRVIVPPNYYINASYVKNTINLNDSMTSDIIYFSLTDTIGTVNIYDTLFACMPCLTDSSITDTNRLYFGSSYTNREIYLELKPINCQDSLLINETDSIVKIIFTANRNTCIDIGDCAKVISDTILTLPYEDIDFTINPNDQISFNPTVTGIENKICFPFSLTNPATVGSTYAPNYFLYMPSVNDASFLSGWTLLNTTTGVFVPMVDSVFQIDSVFSENETVNYYALCANFISCPTNDSVQLQLQFGWHCDGFPSKTIGDTVCGIKSITFNILTDDARVNEYGKILPTLEDIPYSLCAPFSYKKCFKSVQNATVIPLAFQLETPATWLNFVSFYVSRDSCPNGTLPILLPPDSVGSTTFSIPDSTLLALGYTDTLLHLGDCLCGTITFQSECDTSGGTLPNIKLSGESYCGDTLSIEVLTFYKAVWDGASACHDCFEITKSLNSYNDTIRTGDTLTYNITIYPNNADSVTVILFDSLPAGFVVTSSNIPPWIVVPATDSITFQLQGYFTITGSCPDLQNEVFLQYLDYDINNNPTSTYIIDQDTACLEVISKCITSNTIIFRANESTSNGYPSSYSNEHIYLEGDFYMDMNMSFENCIIKTKAGSRLIVPGTDTIVFFNTTISACDTMWQGIEVKDKGTIYLENLNSIQDAHEAINLGLLGNLFMANSEIINSVTGVKIPPAYPNLFGGSIYIRETIFGMYTNAFLPDYLGQNSHGTIPYAGIDISDAVLEIGDDLHGANIFHNMNIGIKGYRCNLDIFNCVFDSIQQATYDGQGNGSAVVGIGDLELSIPSTIRVNPLTTTQNNMTLCYTGVYTFYSELTVLSNVMRQMRNGILVNSCKDGLTTHLQANQIESTHYGITLYDNATGGGVFVEDNQITIDGFKGGIGILVKELIFGSNVNYQINANQVELVNGAAGIQTANVKDAIITYNYVHLSEGAGTAPSSAGIELTATTRTTVNCNTVMGFTDADAKTKGFITSQSPSNTINCNTADTVGYGYFFGGAMCTNTIFQGNYMGVSYTGLYLNSEATIGKQPSNQTPPYHGNIWLDTLRYYSGYGAVNLNTDTIGLVQQSLFTTNQNVSSHNPKIPLNLNNPPFYVDDNGWFFKFPTGNSFNCSSNWTCATFIVGDGEDEYRAMVVNDSTVSSVFIPESKIMAQQLVFKEMKQDSLLLNSETLYQTFVSENEDEVIGKLYATNVKLNEIGNTSYIINNFINSTRQVVKTLSDSIKYIDSLLYINSTASLIQQKENLIYSIISQRTVLNTLGDQIKSNDADLLSIANTKNSEALPDELPDANEKLMNEITIGYKISGISFLLNNYESILQIAIQCPYSGGVAVSSARAFIHLLNDTLVYDDESICGAMGIFRMQNTKEEIEAASLAVFPNPSSGVFQFVFSSLIGDQFNCEINNLFGQNVFNKQILTKSNTFQLDLTLLNNGIYSIRIIDKNRSQLTEKIIISK